MFSREWSILIVDDEPDVLEVTRLALKNVKVLGLPLAIHSARSAAEARELLRTELTLPNGLCNVAVAFIDVVMESDSAGLDLCRFIREELHSATTQIFVRTGQPGVAPEREVIDAYDISGYFTKHETTEDKLYSLVKSGVRHWYTLLFDAFVTESLHALATVAHSRDGVRQVLQASLTGAGEEGKHMAEAVFIDDEAVLLWNLDQTDAAALRGALEERPGIAIAPTGDTLVSHDRDFMISIAATELSSRLVVVGRGSAPFPVEVLRMFHRIFRTISQVWKLTG